MSAISPTRPDVVAFLAEASAALGVTLPEAKDVFHFGRADVPGSRERGLAKVLARSKTGTTSWPVPEPLHWGVGDVSVILDGNTGGGGEGAGEGGRPAAVMRTLSLVRCAFRDVTVEFAESEDEGGYDGYRQGHIDFYRKGPNGEKFNDDSEVLCERFEIIYPPKPAE